MSPDLFARALFLTAGLLLCGCSLFDSDEPATPSPSPPVQPTTEQPTTVPPTPEQPTPDTSPDLEVQVLPVAWSGPYALPVYEGAEVRPPFTDVVEGEAAWRLYVVEGDGEPRLLHESDRWIRAPSWSNDGSTLVLPYFTRSEGIGYGFGFVSLDLTSSSIGWDFRRPDQFRLQLHPSPDGTRFLVEDQEGATPPFLRGRYHLGAPDEPGLSLDGFVPEDFSGWSPDGRYFVSSGFAGPVLNPQEQSRDYFLLEPGQDEAVLFGRAPQGLGLNIAWAPDSPRIAFTEGTSLVVFDAVSRDRENIDLGVELTSLPAWSSDGRYVAISDGVVDVEAGMIILQPSGDEAMTSAVSPGGAWLVRTTDIFGHCQPPSVQQGNLTLLIDVASGQETTLFDCDDGVHSRLQWLSADRLLIWSPACVACESGSNRIKLLSVPGMQVQELSDGLETGADAAVSPDGERILVSGNRLRLYSREGELLRAIEVPDGRRVSGVSWSPDGARYTYIVGPSVINLPP